MAQKGLSLLLIAALCLTFGCASEQTPAQNENTQQDQTASTEKQPARQDNASQQQLVGVWLGSASLDEPLVESAFELLSTAEQQTAFVDQAEAFLSTVMAIQFKADGTFEQDIELAVTGLRQVGHGTWKVVEQTGDSLTVETREKDSEGKEIVAKRVFRLEPSGNQFSMSAPVSQSLAKCNPQIVFARQQNLIDDRTANADQDLAR